MADHGDSPTASENEDGDGKMPARPKTSDEKHRNERQKRPKRKRSASSQSGEGLDAMIALAQPPTTNALGASSTLDTTQTSASSQLPSSASITVPNQSQPLNLQHLFGMAAPTLFNPLVAGQDTTRPSRPGDTSVLDQQQQLALLQQLWGLATYPILASSLAMHLPGNFVNHPAAAANPSFVLPSLTNKPALYPFAPTGAASTSATSPDLNALIHQARMIVEAAAQGPREAPPDPDPSTTGRPPFVLYIACDDDSLSDYQCLVRRQIEVFEATRRMWSRMPRVAIAPLCWGKWAFGADTARCCRPSIARGGLSTIRPSCRVFIKRRKTWRWRIWGSIVYKSPARFGINSTNCGRESHRRVEAKTIGRMAYEFWG